MSAGMSAGAPDGDGDHAAAGPTADRIRSALDTVRDPEIGRPITDLGMVRSVEVTADGTVTVGVLLTVAGCPMREEITARVRGALLPVPGVRDVTVDLGVMSDEQ
ncbi:MAG: metal-sulfur cluster assembly factor, partial [Actinomycetes bacterium]